MYNLAVVEFPHPTDDMAEGRVLKGGVSWCAHHATVLRVAARLGCQLVLNKNAGKACVGIALFQHPFKRASEEKERRRPHTCPGVWGKSRGPCTVPRYLN